MPKTISRSELTERLKSAARPVVIETLPAKYYLSGHLPAALHMPHERTAELASALVPDQSAEVVVYCASGTCRNSHLAAEMLEGLGYRNVRIYGGGKKDWTEAGLNLESGGTAN